ncbi:MAG: Eco57I restriction-modification methylase domain-containing protein [bacterium]|nr:Eco57I restriction-modification methylase domain-containing protein [bacterium]
MTDNLSRYLLQGDFESLFIEGMGWDNPPDYQVVLIEGREDFSGVALAEKRGVIAWKVDCPNGQPSAAEQQAAHRALKRHSRDLLIIFVSPQQHKWIWPELRPSGVGHRLVPHVYPADQPSEAILQRLARSTFTLAEESALTSSLVLTRVRLSFNADAVTRSFFKEFKEHRKRFAAKIEGIPDEDQLLWYASVLLNRLMFVYFIQQKGFLDGDREYLRHRLEMVRDHYGPDEFYAFFRKFLLPLFHQGLGSGQPVGDDPEVGRIVGSVPYVNGGIFEPHELEIAHQVKIKDCAFVGLFDFFDQWKWHLDESPTGEFKEISPDILGYIFEQYINQKEKGAYYTKPDVTGYMSESTILPALADRLEAAGLDSPALLLAGSDDTYIRDALSHGIHQEISVPGGGVWPWQLRSGNPDDYVEDLPPPGEDVALPGERWCDVVHRRDRYRRQLELLSDPHRTWTIDDAITENLDLPELMRDYLIQLANPEECQTAFDVLRSLTVCDPTVGSGAFLLAALDVLDPLYTILMERAQEIAAENPESGGPPFLAEALAHPSPRYWLLKTLCLNNLFGVDLMAEATEIAKLRLFLKLAAQLKDTADIEPLPDLDFNVKAGNLLVGIADGEDIERRFQARGILPFGIENLEEAVQSAGEAHDRFIAAQAVETGDQTGGAKQELQAAIREVTEQADEGLYQMRNESQELKEWRQTHRPFHWFAEFPSVWRNGGFDVIIGNPPYINKNKVKGYSWEGYQTQKCPDLYAVCMERASTLLNDQGRFAMIVMHNLCFSGKYHLLRAWLRTVFTKQWISSYWSGRRGLFTGVNPRNSIAIGKRSVKKSTKNVNSKLYVTRHNRWLTESRKNLFSTIEYGKSSLTLEKLVTISQWPRVDPSISLALKMVVSRNSLLKISLTQKNTYPLG